MNNAQTKDLTSELKAAGASDNELKKLVQVADRLSGLKSAEMRSGINIKKDRKPFTSLLSIGVSSVAGLALGMLLIILSQSVLPGNIFFPIQKASDNLTATLEHSYRGAVMMKRADQVKQLVSKNASFSRVVSALDDYKQQAASYKSVSSNYAAFDYCKARLQEAATVAPSQEKQAIDNTLRSLDNV